MTSSAELNREHHPDAIRARLEAPKPNYIDSGILGAIDGTVTTFAIVAAAVAGGLSETAIIVLGFANLLADGFSMAVARIRLTVRNVWISMSEA